MRQAGQASRPGLHQLRPLPPPGAAPRRRHHLASADLPTPDHLNPSPLKPEEPIKRLEENRELKRANEILHRASASTGLTQPAGTTSSISSWPRCRGWPGSTRPASTATAATCHRQSSRRRSTLLLRPTRPWLESKAESLHQTQGGSVFGAPVGSLNATPVEEALSRGRHEAGARTGLTPTPCGVIGRGWS